MIPCTVHGRALKTVYPFTQKYRLGIVLARHSAEASKPRFRMSAPVPGSLPRKAR